MDALLKVSLLIATVFVSSNTPVPAADDNRFPPFNTRVGTQGFSPKYSFSTTETQLVEMGRRMFELGSDVVKFRLGPDGAKACERYPDLRTFAERDPSCRELFAMPFRWYFLWAYPLGNGEHPWRKGLSAEAAEVEYRQIFDLSRYLLRTYSGTGKSFLLGHWEGDWSLKGSFRAEDEPSTRAVEGMREWYRVRQRAVEDARAAEPHRNVAVLHYAEVNLVKQGLSGSATVTNSVLPHCKLDLVSYSSYDALGAPFPETLWTCLDEIMSRAQLSGVVWPGVFLGEYGYPLAGGNLTPDEQGEKTRELIKAAVSWGCPFVLYWQIYDNEAGDATKGFWLIDNNNEKQPAWHVHQAFLARAHAFKNLYRVWLNRNPDETAFRQFGGAFDSFQTSEKLAHILNSAEYRALISDEKFADFLGSFSSQGHADDPAAMPRQIRDQQARGRTRVELLNWVLDSATYAKSVADGAFAEALARDILRLRGEAKTRIREELQRRLVLGERRSVLWRELLDSDSFYLAELELRLDDRRNALEISAKHLPPGMKLPDPLR